MNLMCLRESIRTIAEIHHTRSGGPGGQNVNKVNTKVIIRLNPAKLEGLSEAEKHRLGETLGPRLTREGELVIASSESRSQRFNLERAFSRVETIIIASVRLPKRRKPVKPSQSVKEKRLESKRRHSQKKSERHIDEKVLH